jgi:S1-C subfamily serine protease
MTGIAGDPVNTPEELAFRLSALGLGAGAEIAYLRDGDPATARVLLAPAPEDPPRDERRIGADVALRGLAVARVNPAVIEELGLAESATGVVVLEVADRSARTGLLPGDILLAINGRRITTTEAVERAAVDRTRFWQIDVQRGEQVLRLRFRI